MPSYPIKSGATFDLETPPNGRHHYFVLYGPNPDGEVIIVNMDSIKSDFPYDPTCTLTPKEGGCGFITRKSYINYRRAEVKLLSEVEKKLDEMKISCFGEIDVKFLNRIRTGLISSPHTPRKVKEATKRF